jgi:ABC-2 type transport system permease protein
MLSIFTATVSETRKEIFLLATYKAEILFGLVATAISFLGISYVIGDGKPSPERMASTLVGYLIWYYVTLITENMGESLIAESKTGTLEQMFISPIPIGFILIGRILANLLTTSLQLLLVGSVITVAFKLPLQGRIDAIPVGIIALLGLFGFGFMLGGIALIFKQVGTLTRVITSILIFLNGALVPIDQFPVWLLTIARILPSTVGISVMRSILLDNLTLSEVWNNGSLPLLIIHSAVYLITGWLVLQWCIRVVKRQGTVGQY